MTDNEKIEELTNRNAIRNGDMNLKRDFQEAITFGREDMRSDLRQLIEEKGHQQDDDTIWCNMDELLDSPLLSSHKPL